jgi:hypothetical protein
MRIDHFSGSFLKLSLASLKIQVKLHQPAALVLLLLPMGTDGTVSRQNASHLLHAQAAAAREAERSRRKAETDSMRAKYGMAKDKP